MNPASTKQDHKQSEEQLSLLQTISMEVAAASDLASALEVVLREVCEKTGWVVGQAWVPNPDATALDLVAAWYFGNGELKPFRALSEESHFKPGVGLPGRVWESKQPVWVEDVINDPNFPRSAAARTARLKTGVAIPILSRRKVIAVLEFFMRESRSQNEQLVNVIVAVAAQLGLMMERKRAAEQLSDTNEILQSILSNMGTQLLLLTRAATFSSLIRQPSACSEKVQFTCHLPNGRSVTGYICRTRQPLFRTINCL